MGFVLLSESSQINGVRPQFVGGQPHVAGVEGVVTEGETETGPPWMQ